MIIEVHHRHYSDVSMRCMHRRELADLKIKSGTFNMKFTNGNNNDFTLPENMVLKRMALCMGTIVNYSYTKKR